MKNSAGKLVAGDSKNPNYGRITSFSLRGSRLGDKYEKLMEEQGTKYLLDFPRGFAPSTISPTAVIDLDAVFGRSAPIIVEIGPGSGEQLISSAVAHPEWNFLAFEAWRPGVARCVQRALQADVKNVRIAELDAAQGLPIVFGSQLSPRFTDSDLCSAQFATEVWTFFPDPWRKKKHRKRRIVSPKFAQIVASVLNEGGIWRMATDWANYAWQMRDVLMESPWFDLQYAGENVDLADEGLYQGGFAPRFTGRVCTRFEERGIEAQRNIYDLLAVRNSLPIFDAKVPLDPWVAAVERGVDVLANRGGERAPSSRRGFQKAQAQVAASAVDARKIELSSGFITEFNSAEEEK